MSAETDLKAVEKAMGILVNSIRKHGGSESELKRLEKYASAITALKNKVQQERREAVNRNARR